MQFSQSGSLTTCTRRCWRRACRQFACAIVAGGVVLLEVQDAAGQAAQATLSGTVRNADGRALAGVRLMVLNASLGAVSGPDGRYRLEGIPAGRRTIEVQSLGYETHRFELHFADGLVERRDIRLNAEPIALDTLEAAARRRMTPGMRGFYERRDRARGHFFTREQIAAMQPRLMTDVLRRVPGMQIVPLHGGFGSTFIATMSRASGMGGGQGCSVIYFLNGSRFPLSRDIGINNFVAVDEVIGVEVYSGTSTIPPQFVTRDSRCGVVAIWTRYRDDDSPSLR